MDKSQNQFVTQHTENGVVILTITEPTLNANAVAEVLSVINASKHLRKSSSTVSPFATSSVAVFVQIKSHSHHS